MHINRRQSFILSILVVIIFFGAGIYFSKVTGPGGDLIKVEEQEHGNPEIAKTTVEVPVQNPELPETVEVTSKRKQKKKQKKKLKGQEAALESSEQVEGIENLEQAQQKVSFSLDNFHRSEIRDGKKYWEIKARNAEYDPATGRTTVSAAEVWLYRKNGDVIYLTSQKARLVLEGAGFKEAHLTSDIILKINQNVTVTADKAHYNHAEQTVTAPGPVTISGEFYNITGKKLLANLESEEFTLVKDVESVLTPDKSKKGA